MKKPGRARLFHSISPTDGSFMHPKVSTRWFIQSGSCHRILAFHYGSGQNENKIKSDRGLVKGLLHNCNIGVFSTETDHKVFVTDCSIIEGHILSPACKARHHEGVLDCYVLFRTKLRSECAQYDLIGNLLDLFPNGSAELSHTRTIPRYIALHCSISLI